MPRKPQNPRQIRRVPQKGTGNRTGGYIDLRKRRLGAFRRQGWTGRVARGPFRTPYG